MAVRELTGRPAAPARGVGAGAPARPAPAGDEARPPSREGRRASSGAGGAGARKDRIRVLHVIHDLNYGGMERLLSDLVRRLDRGRFEPHVLALAYLGRFSRGLEEVASLHLLEGQRPWSLLWPRRLAARIREIAPDVVHSHSGVWHKASLAARLAAVPRVVHTEHGRPDPDPWIGRLLDRLGSGRTDVTVAVSRREADRLARSVVARRDRIRVVLNGVDADRFQPRPGARRRIRRELDIPPGAGVVGTVGRLEPVKGPDVLVEALLRLRASGSAGTPPVLVVAGDGSERERLERRVAEAGVSPAVRFLGWRDDVPELLAAFDVFTLASRHEGTSVSLLEAMSAGVCPVVTRVGGTPRVLGRGLRHRLVPPDEPGALARAWRDALGDDRRRRKDGEAARSRVRRHFSLEGMVRRYEAIYAGEPVEPAAGGRDGAAGAGAAP